MIRLLRDSGSRRSSRRRLCLGCRVQALTTMPPAKKHAAGLASRRNRSGIRPSCAYICSSKKTLHNPLSCTHFPLFSGRNNIQRVCAASKLIHSNRRPPPWRNNGKRSCQPFGLGDYIYPHLTQAKFILGLNITIISQHYIYILIYEYKFIFSPAFFSCGATSYTQS